MIRLVSATLVVVFVLAICPGRMFAGPRTVTLTTDQETALLYATELATAAQAGKLDTDGKPVPALTLDAVLAQIVAADLANVLRNMRVTVGPLVKQLKVLDATNQAKILAT